MSSKRPSRSKAETQDELNELSGRHSAKDALSDKEKADRFLKQEEIKASVAGLSISKAVQDVTKSSLAVQQAFSQVNAELTAQTQLLGQVQSAIQVEKEELERLHGVDIVASSIDDLLMTMNQTKTRWELEKAEQVRSTQEQRSEREKQWDREEDEHRYVFEQKKKLDQDKFQAELDEARRAEQDKQRELVRSWNERETQLRSREVEFHQYKEKADKFPAELEAEVKKQVAIVSSSLKKDHDHVLALIQKEREGEKAALSLQSAQVAAENRRLQEQVKEMQDKLSEAYAKNTELSSKALDAASGRQALNEIRELSVRENNSPVRKS